MHSQGRKKRNRIPEYCITHKGQHHTRTEGVTAGHSLPPGTLLPPLCCSHKYTAVQSTVCCLSNSCTMLSSHTYKQAAKVRMHVMCRLGCDFCTTLTPFLLPPPSFPPFIVFVFHMQPAFRPTIHPKTKTWSFSDCALSFTSCYKNLFPSHALILALWQQRLSACNAAISNWLKGNTQAHKTSTHQSVFPEELPW